MCFTRPSFNALNLTSPRKETLLNDRSPLVCSRVNDFAMSSGYTVHGNIGLDESAFIGCLQLFSNEECGPACNGRILSHFIAAHRSSEVRTSSAHELATEAARA